MRQKILRGMSFVAVAVLLGVYLAQAQNQGGLQADFTPLIPQKVDARAELAKVTTEDESALTSKGYVKIGTVKAAQPRGKRSAEVTEGLRAAALGKAAGAGGDIVRFEREGAVDTAEVPTGKTGRVCAEEKQESASQFVTKPCYTDGTGLHCPTGQSETKSITKCLRWETVEKTKGVESLVSEGTVWRYDAKLIADIAGANETAREADQAFVPLDEMLDRRQYAEAKLLVAHGADVNARDKDGSTHLHRAAWSGEIKAVELLLACGAEVKAKDKNGDMPLYMAGHGGVSVAELLLAHGADANAKDNYGSTPLYEAASSGNKEVAELLLAHGADVNARDTHGRTPLSVIMRIPGSNYKKTEKCLRRHGGHE